MISSKSQSAEQQVFHRLRAKAIFLSLALIVIFTASAMPEGVEAATIPVPAGANLQTAINNAQPGDTLVLDAGAIYRGNFRLPYKFGSSYITITSSHLPYLPAEGQRVSLNHAQYMPKIVSPGNNLPALQTDPYAHHYRIVGVEITLDQNVAVETLVELGSRYYNEQYSLDMVPKYITLDRCYIHGHPGQELKRGVALNSAHTEIKNSHISECHLIGADSQAICGWNGPGPFSIVNNYLEGAGENLMFGGADPVIPNLVPSDIEIRRNHFYKPIEWRINANWSEKNLLELKNAQRVIIDGNVFENSWAEGQDGYAILFTPRNQGNTAPWSVVQDVQFTRNIVRGAGSGVQLLGTDYIHPSQQMKRITIANNLFEDIDGGKWGGHGWFMSISDGVQNLTIDHNTIFQSSSIINVGGTATTGFVFTNNIMRHNEYGVKGDGLQPGSSTLNTYFPGHTFLRNLMTGGTQEWPSYPYPNPGSNYYLPVSSFDAQFVNRAGCDYRIASTSPGFAGGTDGKDVGADIVALNALTAGVVAGTSATVGFSGCTYTVNEGVVNTPQGFGSVSVNVVRTDVSAAATVKYFSSDSFGGTPCDLGTTGVASQRCDYALVAGTLRFAVGEGSKTITIPIVNDGYVEGPEFFTLWLHSSTGVKIGVGQVNITIQDNDVNPTLGSNNPYLSNEYFVRQVYLDILGREPDQDGYSTWTGVLNGCGPEKGFLNAPTGCDRTHVSHGFVASPEGTDRSYLLYRMYEVGLGRLPRYNELMPEMTALPWSSELDQHTTQFAESFTTRQGFTNRYGDVMAPSQASQLITRLENNAGVTLPASTSTLPGQPPQYGRQELINKRLSGEFSVGQIFKAFVQQKVVYDRYFERGYVTMLYFGFLRRDPDLNDPNLIGWTDWVDVFTNGRGNVPPRDTRHLIFGFIYSTEYRMRFGAP